jgi:hypothetical protein
MAIEHFGLDVGALVGKAGGRMDFHELQAKARDVRPVNRPDGVCCDR